MGFHGRRGRLAWYVEPAAVHALIGSVEAGVAWRGRVPFQLLRGHRQGGVRGYGASRLVGATRAVVRLEERWSLDGPTQHTAFGLVGFVDVGQVWAGEAPFGASSRMTVGAGVGLLNPGSRRT